MSVLMRSFILSLCLFFANNAFALELTKPSIEAFLTKINKDASARDVDALAKSVSDAIQIVYTFDIQGQKQTLQFSKDQYISNLKQGWAIASDYEHDQTITNIEINSDKAFFQAITKEKTTIQGQTFSSTTQSEGVIEIIDGKFQVTKLIGQTTVQ